MVNRVSILAILLSIFLVIVPVLAQSAETKEAPASEKNDKTKAGVKFFIFKEGCLEKFLKLDISDIDCIKFTISKGIGYAIVVGAGILKVPQIMKILKNSSVDGLNTYSYYIESLVYINTTG